MKSVVLQIVSFVMFSVDFKSDNASRMNSNFEFEANKKVALLVFVQTLAGTLKLLSGLHGYE